MPLMEDTVTENYITIGSRKERRERGYRVCIGLWISWDWEDAKTD